MVFYFHFTKVRYKSFAIYALSQKYEQKKARHNNVNQKPIQNECNQTTTDSWGVMQAFQTKWMKEITKLWTQHNTTHLPSKMNNWRKCHNQVKCAHSSHGRMDKYLVSNGFFLVGFKWHSHIVWSLAWRHECNYILMKDDDDDEKMKKKKRIYRRSVAMSPSPQQYIQFIVIFSVHRRNA